MIVPDGTQVPYPSLTKDLHHEVELGVALKDGGSDLAEAAALEAIYGYAVGIDLTRRDLQFASREKKQPWEIGKSFEASAPVGALRPAAEIGHPAKGRIWLKVNGAEKQNGDLAQMIWSVPEIVARLSRQVRLAAGDIIMTGTPAGVGPLAPGDKVEAGIDGIGELRIAITPST
jgi:fumarylpyruvate hydrolase